MSKPNHNRSQAPVAPKPVSAAPVATPAPVALEAAQAPAPVAAAPVADEPKVFRIRITKGAHREGGKDYLPGDIIPSKTDLVKRFGTERFEYV